MNELRTMEVVRRQQEGSLSTLIKASKSRRILLTCIVQNLCSLYPAPMLILFVFTFPKILTKNQSILAVNRVFWRLPFEPWPSHRLRGLPHECGGGKVRVKLPLCLSTTAWNITGEWRWNYTQYRPRH